MSKRTKPAKLMSDGERLMRKHFDATFDGDVEIIAAARDIDRVIRKRQIEAWEFGHTSPVLQSNPYREREK